MGLVATGAHQAARWMREALLYVFFVVIVLVLPLEPVISMPALPSNQLVELTGMISPALSHSHFEGAADEQQQIALSLGLRPRHQLLLHHYLQDISQSRHFLTPEQYTDTFSPDEATYNEIYQFLQQAAFKVTHMYSHRLLLDFSGTIGQVEQVFHVKIHLYRGPDGRTYYANSDNPLLPAQFADQVLAINGLNSALHWHPSQLISHLLPTAKTLPRGEQCPKHNNMYLTPDQFASAYGLNKLYQAHYQGEGQTIALFELSPFNTSDIKAYTACFGHSRTAIQALQTGSGLLPDDGVMEVEMDIELILSAAPHLKTLKIYEAGNDTAGYLSQWARIIQDASPVVSTSWGLCEQTLDPPLIQEENALFTVAAAQGQNIFASTGDTGSSGCLGDTAIPSTALGVDDPAAQPSVISVGGTSLTLKETSSYSDETVWNTTKKRQTNYDGATGGGISRYWVRPAWQKMLGVNNMYSTGTLCGARSGTICREVPDVSLHANTDRGYIIYCSAKATANCSSNQPWNVVGGTSVSTPLWAVLAALANEMLQKHGGFRLGFINPLLYQIASDPRKYRTCFHDVIKGNNDYNGVNHGRYPASVGYDMATGLGSYNAYALAHSLVEQVQKLHASKRSSPMKKRNK